MIKEFLFQPSDFPHAHCATLTLHKNEVYCCWYVYPEDECKDAKIVVANFDSSQRRWRDTLIAFPEIRKSQGNPLLFSFKEKLYLLFVILDGQYWNSAKTFISEFNEAKKEFSAPLKTELDLGMMIRHRPFIKEDGILLPTYDETTFQSMILKSSPPFLRYDKVGELDPGPIQGDFLHQDKESFLFVLRSTDDSRKVHRAHTMDGGKTYPFTYKTPFDCPLSGIAALYVDDKKEKIVLAHNDTEEQKRTPLTLSFSKDTLKSRSGKWDLETSPGEYSYPSLLKDAQGNIHLVYTHNRQKIGHYFFHTDDFNNYWGDNG